MLVGAVMLDQHKDQIGLGLLGVGVVTLLLANALVRRSARAPRNVTDEGLLAGKTSATGPAPRPPPKGPQDPQAINRSSPLPPQQVQLAPPTEPSSIIARGLAPTYEWLDRQLMLLSGAEPVRAPASVMCARRPGAAAGRHVEVKSRPPVRAGRSGCPVRSEQGHLRRLSTRRVPGSCSRCCSAPAIRRLPVPADSRLRNLRSGASCAVTWTPFTTVASSTTDWLICRTSTPAGTART